MNLHWIAAAGVVASFFAAGCSSSSEHVEKLRAALDRAELSLRESVAVAEAEMSGGVGVEAALLVDADPVFSVGALANGAAQDVRIDIVSGEVLSMSARTLSNPCPESISLVDSILIAEAEVSGEAVAIEPDDDDACAREVQVLSGDTLWEVKVASGGAVLETEESDEYEEDD